MGLFDQDIGWAGAYTPLVVSTGCMDELRNLAGPPQFPGAKWVMVNLSDGEFKWYTAGKSRQTGRSRSRRR